jgi:hypothetical protein
LQKSSSFGAHFFMQSLLGNDRARADACENGLLAKAAVLLQSQDHTREQESVQIELAQTPADKAGEPGQAGQINLS